MVWRKLNHAWLSSSPISKLRFSSIIMLPSYSSIESPFWLDYSGDSYVAGFFLNPKSERLEIQEIFLAFRVFFSRLKIQSERTIWWALQSMQIFLHFSVSQQDLDQTRIFLERPNPLGLRQKKWRYREWGQYFLVNYIRRKKIKSRSQCYWLCHGISPWYVRTFCRTHLFWELKASLKHLPGYHCNERCMEIGTPRARCMVIASAEYFYPLWDIE